MRSRTIAVAAAVLLCTALVTESGAIVIRHDRDEADYRALGEKYPAVCKIFPDGTGVLVAPRWVLTAAHVAQIMERREGAVRFGDEDYNVGKVFLNPDWRGREHDVALLKLDRPVVGIEPVHLNAGRDEAGKQIVFVGYGDFGTGEIGIQHMDGVLRGATNRVDKVDENWVFFTFFAPGKATRLEGISGPGDSGGPALFERDGRVWTLGVSSAGLSEDGQKPGTYGVGEIYTRVSTHLEWIRETMENDTGGFVVRGNKRAKDTGGIVVSRHFATGSIPPEILRSRALAFVDAYNSDDDTTLMEFFAEHMGQDEGSRPVEQRIASIRRIHREWGDVEMMRTLMQPSKVDVVCRGEKGVLTFGLQLLAEQPHRIDQIFLDEGAPDEPRSRG